MFLEWSPMFETGISPVDEQHKKLFQMLNRMAADVSQTKQGRGQLEKALNALRAYAEQHFVDEEMVMAHSHVVQRHVHLHRMEHKSFIYDVNRMGDNALADEELTGRFEGAIQFVASWLAYHTLRTDQIMGFQISTIKSGMSPEAVYDLSLKEKPNPANTQLVLEAVLHLWAEQTERCRYLEEKLARQAGDDTRLSFA